MHAGCQLCLGLCIQELSARAIPHFAVEEGTWILAVSTGVQLLTGLSGAGHC